LGTASPEGRGGRVADGSLGHSFGSVAATSRAGGAGVNAMGVVTPGDRSACQ
jgi:hypothetical protein